MKTCMKALSTLTILLVLLTACNGGGAAERGEDNAPSEQKDPAQEKETRIITFYFSDSQLMKIYREEREVEVPDEAKPEQLALDLWAAGPEGSGLEGLVPDGTRVEWVKEENGTAYVSFSENIRDANLGSSGEQALVEQVVMIMEQFGYRQTRILVEGETVETLLGHMTLEDPIPAKDPNDFELVNVSG